MFSELINGIQDISGRMPLIILQEEISTNPEWVSTTLSDFMGLDPPKNEPYLESVNRGVYKEQFLWLLRMNRYNKKLSRIGIDLYGPLLEKFGLTPDYIARKRPLWLGKTPMELPEDMKHFVKKYNEEDWSKTMQLMDLQRKSLNIIAS